ncbi:PREDICTED: translin-like [Priapulus caudatus]|uniref:Translin n=1 Tax=Priapulus caudatus TaxID=37621 RepID=A0ABM1F274_PRICU|nr:PREDICTED: translin-like [Priapulus caudatus]
MEAARVTEVFCGFQKYIDSEQDKRDEVRQLVKDLEQSAREILAVMQIIHTDEGLKTISKVCEKARHHFETVRAQFAVLAACVPPSEYFRFNDHWRFVVQRLSFLAALIVYMESEMLITKEEAAAILGIKSSREAGFHLDLDDYLTSTLTLASELSRLAVNAVVAGDYSRPVRVASFVGDLANGFRLLNLKNDSLRKRCDALKYDVKKVEEVVYDLSIRGLRPADA